MVGPGEYVSDSTEGITSVEDLPKPKIKRRSRNHKRQPCPACGHKAYRDKVFTRTLHDLGDLANNRPIDLHVTYSQHCCSKCRKYFNADLTDLADPGCHYPYGCVEQTTSRLFGLLKRHSESAPICSSQSCCIQTRLARFHQPPPCSGWR